MTNFFKKIGLSAAVVSVLALGACNQVTTATDTACKTFNTLQWAIPLVQALASQAGLNPAAQDALVKAEQIVAAGCNPANTTLMAQADGAAATLVAILYPPAVH